MKNSCRYVLSLIAGLLLFAGQASADPYFITYTGTISASDLPEVNNGEAYTATLVFDNGAASTTSQTWGVDDLTCAIFEVNDAQDVQFFHDLTLQGSLSVVGSASTDGGGLLNGNFTYVIASTVDPGTYTHLGIALTEPVSWFMNDINAVFYSPYSDPFPGFSDAAGGVQMASANWTDPAPYTGNCTTKGPIIGVDIEAGQGSPTNWNSYTLADVDSLMSNLIAEDGSTTAVAFQLDGVVTAQDWAPIDGSVIPAHTPDLTTVCCDLLYNGPNPTVATWSGLVPFAVYDYWVFNSSTAVDTITVTGDNVDLFPSPNVDPDEQAINGILGNSGSTFDSYARQITASSQGTITIEILSTGTPTPSGYAVRQHGLVVAPTADLTISKLDTPDPVIAGTELTYTIRVDNIGNAVAENVVVTDTLPAGLTLVSTTGCAEDPGGVPTCSLGSIAGGAYAEYTVIASADPSVLGTVINTVTVTTTSTESDDTNNSATAETTVNAEADLSITKMDSSDPFVSGTMQMLTYTIEVSNAGPSDATNVVVNDILPAFVVSHYTAGCLNDPNGVPDCQLGTIPAGGSAIYTISVQVPRAGGLMTNVVSVSSDASDPVGDNDTVDETTEVIPIPIPTLNTLGLLTLILLLGSMGWVAIRRF